MRFTRKFYTMFTSSKFGDHDTVIVSSLQGIYDMLRGIADEVGDELISFQELEAKFEHRNEINFEFSDTTWVQIQEHPPEMMEKLVRDMEG